MTRISEDTCEIIPIHFDVPDHHLPLSQFIEAAKSAQAVVDNINKEMFEGKLRYKLLVLPPKEGTFLEVLKIAIPIGGAIWAAMSTDIGKAFIKGLTGQEPKYWAEKAGEKIGKHKKPDDKEKNITETREPSEDDTIAIAVILTQMILGFLQKEPAELQKIGLSKEKYREAIKAKNKLYQDCIDNADVKGIGFDTTNVFPIKRKNFPERISTLPAKEEEEITNWKVEIKNLHVNSPNWARDGRKWEGRTDSGKKVWFAIEDDAFWSHVQIKDIQPDINDQMTVQWVFPSDKSQRSKIRVLSVISYNGSDISTELTDAELTQLLTNYSTIESSQDDLFYGFVDDEDEVIKIEE